MKKTTGLMTVCIAIFIMSCGDEKKPVEAVKPAPAETKKEIIVVNPAPTIIVKDPPAKPTTITLDKNGVKVGTKKS